MYEKLKAILKEKGISVYRLSQLSKISSPDLYNVLSGKRPMYPNWKKRICDFLELPEEELFEEGEGHE